MGILSALFGKKETVNIGELIKNGAQPYKKFYFSKWFYNVL
jgi:hypothetical protein